MITPKRFLTTLKARGAFGSLLRAYDRLCNVAFDLAHGVDTRFRSRERENVVNGLPVERVHHANPWQPSVRRTLRHTLQSLHVPLSDYTFIDIGSGKGKAVLVASEFPFRRVIGIEYCSALVDVAKRNIQRYRNRRAAHVDCLCCDACEYTFPATPTVYFLFNPFDRTILSTVLRNIALATAEVSKPSFLLYDNPVYLPIVLETSGWRVLAHSGDIAILGLKPRSDASARSLPTEHDAVEITYTRITEDQLDKVVKLHDAVFPNSTTSKLGVSKAALRWHVTGPDRLVSSAASIDGRLVGFGVVVTEYSRFRFAAKNLTLVMRGAARRRKAIFKPAVREAKAALAAILKPKPRERVGKLLLIGISSEYRGLGVGHTLLSRIEQDSRAVGITRLELSVDVANTPAIRLYEKNQWRKVPQHGAWRGLMSKVLDDHSNGAIS